MQGVASTSITARYVSWRNAGPVNVSGFLETVRQALRGQLSDMMLYREEDGRAEEYRLQRWQNGINLGASDVLYRLEADDLARFPMAIRPRLRELMNGPEQTLRHGNVVGGGVVEAWASWTLVEDAFMTPLYDAIEQANGPRSSNLFEQLEDGFLLGLPIFEDARTLDAKELEQVMLQLPATLKPVVAEALKKLQG